MFWGEAGHLGSPSVVTSAVKVRPRPDALPEASGRSPRVSYSRMAPRSPALPQGSQARGQVGDELPGPPHSAPMSRAWQPAFSWIPGSAC